MDAHAAEIARLEGIMAGDAGAPAFPALAEAQRRAGRPADAERIARAGLRAHPEQVAGRVALGLALLDLGRMEDARAELARALEATPDHVLARGALGEAGEAPAAGDWDESPLARIGEGEIEAAVAAARAEREAMLDADRVALAALREVGEPETEPAAGEDALARMADGSSPFATRTVADLLERQGDRAHAERVRRAAAERSGARSEREVLIARLEAWLARLRGEAR
jgi:tetratricopeptide (TPR) repeat protein